MTAGLILIDKEAGLSSAGVVAQVKRALGGRIKVGHAGTLDPAATGLLVCLIGNATRIAHYLEAGEKIYSGEIELGVRTLTDDLDGEIIARAEVAVSDAAIQEAVSKFMGAIEQIPPQISAVKVGGERAYARARAGEFVNITPRSVTVSEFAVERISNNRLRYRVRCSKGTYIRSLARDLGQALGCGGAVATLRREASAPFSTDRAVLVNEVSSRAIIPWPEAFPGVSRRFVEPQEIMLLQRGDERAFARLISAEADGPVIIMCEEGPFGLLVRDQGRRNLVRIGASNGADNE